jgi:hypothetical protein
MVLFIDLVLTWNYTAHYSLVKSHYSVAGRGVHTGSVFPKGVKLLTVGAVTTDSGKLFQVLITRCDYD